MALIFDHIEEVIASAVRSASKSIVILCPFIKIDTLSRLLSCDTSSIDLEIVTSWKASNFLTGASDVKLFDLCKERNIALKMNNNIHFKIWLIDNIKLIAGSANISESAITSKVNSNYEFLIDVSATQSDLRYINNVRNESLLITEDIYQRTLALLETMEPVTIGNPNLNLHED
ncbi:hypothetical protein KA005_25445, partial [bacterium]|nr:hypothetical protein [bacterium]